MKIRNILFWLMLAVCAAIPPCAAQPRLESPTNKQPADPAKPAEKKSFLSDDAKAALWGGLAGAVATLAGVYITERGNRKRTDAQQENQRKTLRVLILQEVDHNLRTLGAEYERATKVPPGRNARPMDVLSRTPAPRWNTSIWNSQVAIATLAFEIEELQKMHEFYFRLARITDIWSTLNKIGTDCTVEEGSDLVNLLENEVNDAQAQGNSLRPLSRGATKAGRQLNEFPSASAND